MEISPYNDSIQYSFNNILYSNLIYSIKLIKWAFSDIMDKNNLKEFNVKKIDAIKFSTEGILISANCFLNIDAEEIEGNYKEVILVKEDGTTYVIKKE